MKKDKKMTLEEHIETANDLAIATHHLSRIFSRSQKHYNKSDNIMNFLYKILPSNSNSILARVKNELDGEYHKIINDKEFAELGHIYFKLEERYKNITKQKKTVNGTTITRNEKTK